MRTCGPVEKKQTVEDGSHGDDPTGTLPSGFRGPASFVQRLFATEYARAPVLGTELEPCRSSGNRAQRRKCDFRDSLVHTSADRVLGQTYPEYSMEIKAAAEEELALTIWCRPKLATQGGSVEIGPGFRSLAEGQKQGLWASTVSLKCYEKCGELNREWQRYSDMQQRHFVACEAAEMENRCVARSALSQTT